jgi:hypothetical protein
MRLEPGQPLGHGHGALEPVAPGPQEHGIVGVAAGSERLDLAA